VFGDKFYPVGKMTTSVLDKMCC